MGAKSRHFERWYSEYWAQTWYRNTYLVNRPQEIARERFGERDWNNVYDSGCNFACIAMMAGIDPARLAALLARRRFFTPDRQTLARDMAGRSVFLVWDRNEPATRSSSLSVSDVWDHRLRRRMAVRVQFVEKSVAMRYVEGAALVEDAHRQGLHVICGPDEHSHLVAGRTRAGHFYLWDPDDTEITVEDSLAGRFKLRDLFRIYDDEPIEFWRYRVTRTFQRKRPKVG